MEIHNCESENKPSYSTVLKNLPDGYWWLDYDEGMVTVYHCPYCGVKLETNKVRKT